MAEPKINTSSDTWRAVRNELRERRETLTEELISLSTNEKRTEQIRGAIHEIDLILDLPERTPLGTFEG